MTKKCDFRAFTANVKTAQSNTIDPMFMNTIYEEADWIGIGEFAFSRDESGYLWMSRTGVESMQINAETQAKLHECLNKFWEENF